jgi:RimJ/RimL family protein N-acetyltransferase
MTMVNDILLTTPRLIIREFTAADLDGFHSLASDPDVVRYLAFGPTSLGESEALLQTSLDSQAIDPRASYALAVEDRAGGALVGSCGLEIDPEMTDSAEIYYVFRHTSWGMGYATESVGAVIAHAMHTLGLRRVWAHASLDNPASIRVMEKLGMAFEGKVGGEHHWRDDVSYVILGSGPSGPVAQKA